MMQASKRISSFIISNFIDTYQKLDKDNLHLLTDIYDPSIKFQDPLHQISGLDSLHHYFEKLYANVIHCHFDIHDSFCQDQQAAIYWTMHLQHPKLKSGRLILVDGHSHLTFDEQKITHHRDYFDIGSMLYEQLPVIGAGIKYIKQRASS